MTITKISLKHVLNLCFKQPLKFQVHIVALFIRSGIYYNFPFPGHRADRGSVVDSCTDTPLRRMKEDTGYTSLL